MKLGLKYLIYLTVYGMTLYLLHLFITDHTIWYLAGFFIGMFSHWFLNHNFSSVHGTNGTTTMIGTIKKSVEFEGGSMTVIEEETL